MASIVLENSTQGRNGDTQLWIRLFYGLSNFILALLGISGLIVGIVSQFNSSNELTLLNHYQDVNVKVFSTASIVLITIAFLGVFAGSNKCYNSTLANGVLLACFLISTTAFTITMGMVTDYTSKGNVYRQMQTDMNNYYKSNKLEKNIIDTLHTELSCCGLNDISTWVNYIPSSCCRDNQREKVTCSLGKNMQTNGCFKEFIRTSRYYAYLIFTVLIFAGVIEIFAIILSTMQCRIIKDTERAFLEEENRKDLELLTQLTSMHVENETQDNKKKNEEEEEKVMEIEKKEKKEDQEEEKNVIEEEKKQKKENEENEKKMMEEELKEKKENEEKEKNVENVEDELIEELIDEEVMEKFMKELMNEEVMEEELVEKLMDEEVMEEELKEKKENEEEEIYMVIEKDKKDKNGKAENEQDKKEEEKEEEELKSKEEFDKKTERTENLDKKDDFEEAKQNVEKKMLEIKDEEEEKIKMELSKKNEETEQDTCRTVTSAHVNIN